MHFESHLFYLGSYRRPCSSHPCLAKLLRSMLSCFLFSHQLVKTGRLKHFPSIHGECSVANKNYSEINKMPATLALRVMVGLIHLFRLYASPIDKTILANGIV